MSLRLVIEPEARSEIEAAAAWYEDRSAGLGLRFLEAIGRTLHSIESSPLQNQIVRKRGEVRRAFVRDFPYGLIYVVLEQEIAVIACIHGRRNPVRWQSRIP